MAVDVGMAWMNLFVSPAAAEEANAHDESSHSQHPNYEEEDLGCLPNVTHSFFLLPVEILGWKRLRGGWEERGMGEGAVGRPCFVFAVECRSTNPWFT